MPLMADISFFGTPWVASISILLASLIFFILSYKREALFVLGIFVADGAGVLTKFAINRPRPGSNFVEIFQKLTDPSFPSGHVIHYVVFFGFLSAVVYSIWRPGKLGTVCLSILSIALIVSISISRVYLGAHWPTDVLGGYMFGFVMLWLMLHLYFQE